jgi:DNA-binding IclR family transcriptional regulator
MDRIKAVASGTLHFGANADAILTVLADGQRHRPCDIASASGLSPSCVSAHLRELVAAGGVRHNGKGAPSRRYARRQA